MKNKKLLIAGDIMLDAYHFGQVDRISPEAPVPIFFETGKKSYAPGGAANVAVNMASIGIDTDLFSTTGTDISGKKLLTLLNEGGVNTDLISINREQKTTTKLRYIGQNNQQILRVDMEKEFESNEESIQNAFQKIESDISEYGLIVLSDYNKGFLTRKTTSRLIALGRNAHIPVVVDVKGRNIEKYRGADILKPNRKELSLLTDIPTTDMESVVKAAVYLCEMAQCQYVLATLGAEGMILANRQGLIDEVKNPVREVFDVTGAGDTAIAYFASEMIKGSNLKDAMRIANYAAGVQVSKVGTSIVYPFEVEAAMREDQGGEHSKKLNDCKLDSLVPFILNRGKGRRVVFTNGCFDILHAGHISYLRKARKLGDILVVGINSDDSVKRIKGNNRPVNPLNDRMEMLAAFDFVDYVIPFEEDTPRKLIETIAPDILVKGGDYKMEEIVGADIVKSYGGAVEILPFVEGHSTSEIIKRIQARE